MNAMNPDQTLGGTGNLDFSILSSIITMPTER